MRLEKIKDYQVYDVAKLHKEYITEGFLSTLGISILTLIYKSMINSSNAVCIVVENDNRIRGYVSAAVNVKDFYKVFLRKHFIKSAIILSPNIFRPKVLKKIFETLFYPVREKSSLPDAELLSIVVSDELRGQAIGQHLFEELVKEFKKRNVKTFKAVVGSHLVAPIRFYEKMGGVLYSEIEVHKNEKSKVYTWTL